MKTRLILLVSKLVDENKVYCYNYCADNCDNDCAYDCGDDCVYDCGDDCANENESGQHIHAVAVFFIQNTLCGCSELGFQDA
jgi:hypothetical protein